MNKIKSKDIAKEWDNLSEEFNTYNKDLFSGAADNIHTIWPLVLNLIKKHFSKNGDKLRALDYGCGTGMFCRKLSEINFDVIGMDISPKMLQNAKKHFPEGKFYFGDYNKLPQLSKNRKFDLITGIMVLQFVPDFKKCIQNISKSIDKDGIIIFVVHNPKNLDERKVKKKLNVGNTGKLVTIYRRTSQDYDKIFRNSGFKKITEKYKNSSSVFMKKYKQKPSKTDKYLFMAYRKE